MFQKRIWIFLGFIIFIFFILTLRIFSSQVINYDYYITQARKYATRIELISDPRGKILDRNGSELVNNQLTFDLYVVPARIIPDEPKSSDKSTPKPKASPTAFDIINEISSGLPKSESVYKLSQLLNTPMSNIINKTNNILEKITSRTGDQSDRNKKKYARQQLREKYKIISGIPAEQAMKIYAHPEIFTGFTVDETITRRYLYNELACHLVGYIGPVWKEEYQKLVDGNYFRNMVSPDIDDNTYQALLDMGEFKNKSIGRTGIERLYNSRLVGKSAVRLSEYDYLDKQMQELSRSNSVPPDDIVLTIDLALQKKMESALRNKIGAAIVMNVHTGEILGIASTPSYNLNHLQSPVDRATLNYITKSSDKPLYNRAISGEYPPGSIFKIITGIAALESGKITPYTPFNCTGYYYPSIKKFGCWIVEHNRTHGSISIEEGFQNSCNIYFFNAGRLAGPETIAYWAEQFGLGQTTGIDISGENKGRVPKPDPNSSRPWALADTLNTSIGQGDLMVTPLQIVRMVAAVSNGGKLVTPHVIKNPETETANLKSETIPLSPATIRAVHRGMYKVVHAQGGTANGTDIKNFPVAGKTGTAEVWGKTPHAWFAGFAPYNDPQIAFTVIMEYGGRGSEVSAPIAVAFMPEALAIVEREKSKPVK